MKIIKILCKKQDFLKFKWSAWKLLDCRILHQIPQSFWGSWAAPALIAPRSARCTSLCNPPLEIPVYGPAIPWTDNMDDILWSCYAGFTKKIYSHWHNASFCTCVFSNTLSNWFGSILHSITCNNKQNIILHKHIERLIYFACILQY